MKPGLGLGYMVNPHGADHCCNMHDTMYVTQEQMQALRPLGMLEPVPVGDIGPRKVALFKAVHLEQIVFDSLVLCAFLPYTFEQVADIVAAVTGWDTGVMEQLRVAERILTVARLYDIREGFTEADDTLPRRFFQSKTSAALDVKPLDPAKFEKAKSYYYTLMGWQARTGIPLPEKLEELDIT
jgi:aldehyde:ferredoxin oxidoreductase